MTGGLRVETIPFEALKNYWIEVDHFQDPLKLITSHVGELGPYRCHRKDPPRLCYGLFDGPQMIGGTQLVEWSRDSVRYRTINIRKPYRGNDLGYFLIMTALKRDWSTYGRLFGWVRRSHLDWSVRHGFKEIDGIWEKDHIGMSKPLAMAEGS